MQAIYQTARFMVHQAHIKVYVLQFNKLVRFCDSPSIVPPFMSGGRIASDLHSQPTRHKSIQNDRLDLITYPWNPSFAAIISILTLLLLSIEQLHPRHLRR